MSTDNIPFLDLVTQHRELEEELVAVFRNAIRNAAFVGGPIVETFEREFAAYCGAPHCIGVANGTDALRFAIMAAGVKPGDTVITVPNTFIATTEAISQAGARPDFVDVEPRTYTMDPASLRTYLETQCTRNDQGALVNRRTGSPVTAVIPVHLYGQMADMDPIVALAEEYRLTIIEDACQAHGAEYFSARQQRWLKAGTIGAAAAFSFYPGKNLGACGEAGAITTADARIDRTCRMLREHGQSKKYYHDIEGYNGRLDAIQAAFLSLKLRHLPKWTEARRRSAETYDSLLTAGESAGLPAPPYKPEWSRPVYHLYVVRVAERSAIQDFLQSLGVATGIHYPIPLHLSPAYSALGFAPGDFPIAERAASEVMSLPMFPGLSAEQQARVVSGLGKALNAISAPERTPDLASQAAQPA